MTKIQVLLRTAIEGNQDARHRVYLAGCLAKMQRTGVCSRDFDLGCIEPFTEEHLLWADKILATLARSLSYLDNRTGSGD